MSNTDNYELTKSMMPQGVQYESPFSAKTWNYIPDINAGIYTNSGLATVQFDCASIYNSNYITDANQMLLTIPITWASAYVGGAGGAIAGILAPLPGSVFSTSLKPGYFQLVNSANIDINGKNLEQAQDRLNAYVAFKLLSQASTDDFKAYKETLGLGDYDKNLENWCSQIYTNSSNITAAGGIYPAIQPTCQPNGISNNKPFAFAPALVTQSNTTVGPFANVTAITLGAVNAAIQVGQLVCGSGVPSNTFVVSISGVNLVLSQTATIGAVTTLYFYTPNTSNYGEQSVIAQQFSGTYNPNIYSRMKKYLDTTNPSSLNLVGGSIVTPTGVTTLDNMKKEFRCNYQVVNNIMVWQDIAIIRLSDLFDSIKSLPMSRKLDMQMKFNINVGQVFSLCSGTQGYMLTSGLSNTFTNTCPLIQNSVSVLPTNCTGIASALWVGNPTNTNITIGGYNTAALTSSSINLNPGNIAHYMPQCRLYFPQVSLKQEILSKYISENRNKRICYTTILTNNINNVTAGSTVSPIVQTGVTKIRGVIIIPYISQSTNGASTVASGLGIQAFSQLQSPFDQAPMTSSPVSLINLNVSVGGQNIMQSPVNYGWEHFIENVSIYEKTNAGDLGFSCGLISQEYWNQNRVYYFDCTRCSPADAISNRNIIVNATNNSNCTIDLLVITEYFKEAIFDVDTSAISFTV